MSNPSRTPLMPSCPSPRLHKTPPLAFGVMAAMLDAKRKRHATKQRQRDRRRRASEKARREAELMGGGE